MPFSESLAGIRLKDIARAFSKLKVDELDEARTRAGRIVSAGKWSETRFTEMLRGRRDTRARLDAARAGTMA